MHVHRHMCRRVSMHVHRHMCRHVRMHVHMYMCRCVRTHVHRHMCRHACACVCACKQPTPRSSAAHSSGPIAWLMRSSCAARPMCVRACARACVPCRACRACCRAAVLPCCRAVPCRACRARVLRSYSTGLEPKTQLLVQDRLGFGTGGQVCENCCLDITDRVFDYIYSDDLLKFIKVPAPSL